MAKPYQPPLTRRQRRELQREAKREKEQTLPSVGQAEVPIVGSVMLSDPSKEWKEPLNRADSIGLVSVLVGILFILVSTVWYKALAFGLLCFGTAYLVWFSHWTHRLKKSTKVAVVAATVGFLSWSVLPQFWEQWRLEHMRSELVFDARATGLAYPTGDHYGMKWDKGLAEVRLTVTSQALFPIQNLTLSVGITGSGEAIGGMAQSDSEPDGCAIRKPRENMTVKFPLLRGKDGTFGDISPYMNDLANKDFPWRNHYDILCERLTAKESVPLVLGTGTQRMNGDILAPSQFHITGEYETTPQEGSKRIPVDVFVPIALPSEK